MTNNSEKQNITDTNMLVSMLANSEKLIPKAERYHYIDEHGENEKIESCIDEQPQRPTRPPTPPSNPDNMKQEDPIQQLPEDRPPPEVKLGKQIDLTTDDDVDEYDKATPKRKMMLKMGMIRKLSELVGAGAQLTQNYNMDSDYKTMKYEYELHTSVRNKHRVVNFMQDQCISAVGTLEKLNKKVDYFGLKLDGWYSDISGKSDQIYDTCGELYDKCFTTGGSIHPALMLMGIVGYSAVKTHLTNTTTDQIPSVEDKRRENPQMIENIRQMALGNTISNKPTQFKEKLSRQYENAVEQVKDYQVLRQQEDEYRSRQRNNQNNQNNSDKHNDQPVMRPPSLPMSLQRQKQLPSLGVQIPSGSDMTPEQYRQFRENEILEQKAKFEKQKEKDNVQQKSQKSHVSINPNIDNIIKEADAKQTTSKPRKRRGRKNSIKVDV